MKQPLWSTILSICIFCICILAGFLSTVYISAKKYQPQKASTPIPEQSTTPTPSETTPFSLQPPAQSLKATLTQKKGDVKQKTRETNEYTDATVSGTILVGESIATGKEGEATIDIPALASLSLGENAELVFANIFSANSVFQQKSGSIEYAISSSSPVAVRALHSLVQAATAIIRIIVIDTDVSVTALKGDATIAIVDTQNSTHVYAIPEGKRAIIDDTTRRVTITSPR